MCDESFSINYSCNIPDDCDKGWFMFFVTLFNHSYWVLGATLGGIFGSLITFEFKGLEFAMVSLFVVIFLDKWLKEKNHFSSLIGLFSTVACLLIFGTESFLIPAMLAIIGILTFARAFEKKGGATL